MNSTDTYENHVRATGDREEGFCRQQQQEAGAGRVCRREREDMPKAYEDRLQEDYESFLIHCAEFGISPPDSIHEYQRMV